MLGFFRRHRLVLALLVASTLIAAACAKLNTAGNLEVAGATTHVFVDDPSPSIIDRTALPQDLSSLQKRAELYGRLMTTTPVLDAIAKRAGLPADELSGVADITSSVPIQFTQAGSEQHAGQIVDSRDPYRLELQADPYEPILSIYAEAPDEQQAFGLANAAVSGLRDYLTAVARQDGVSQHELPVLRQLGNAEGGTTNSGARIVIAGLTFITVFALSFVLLLLVARRPWRARADADPRASGGPRLPAHAASDWPHTTRLLPWSVAGLITMFWLTPFDRIQLKVSAPVNLTLDRLVIPIVVVIWLLAFTAGRGSAPRLRLTRVHLAIGAFLACAFLSTVIDARYLNHVGELMLSLKRLPLLVSYMSVFVIVASSVRRSEVPAFMTFTLVLAVVVSLGVIYEYKSGENLFTTLAGKIFVGPFEITGGDLTNASVLDSLGRRWVEGPSAYGVELVAMLSCALPVAILGALRSGTRRQHILYSFAILVLLYAMVATDRKSALIAPVGVFIVVAYFRRHQLASLAPLGIVLVVVAIVLSPAAIRHVVTQFTSADATGVATVSSRTANYDAVRPDLWTHLLLGRGQGTYAPPTDRIVDSEVILRLVETGVLGLVAFLLIPIAVIVVARKTASRPDSRYSAAALTGLAAAVAFIISAVLYSVMSLPHGPDVFLYVAGLAVVASGAMDRPPDPRDHELDAPAYAELELLPVRARTERAIPAG
ncbi:MAG: hypothetical protein ABSH51_05400 [Solirubrobacteraceae bacterium]|jgi:hypothetical protein